MQHTMVFTAALTLLFFIATGMPLPVEAATPLTPAERSFVGEYVQSGSETMTQMAVLDDRTFCFIFMGGSVDLLLAGRWRLAPDGKGILLDEVKVPQPQFPALARPTQGAANSVFEIDGYSMSNAVMPVFATSATAARSGPKRFKVVQYELRGAAKVLVGFNAEQNLIDLSQPVRLAGEMLHLGPQPFARRHPISAERANEAREGCIRPKFAQAAAKAPTMRSQEGEAHEPTLISRAVSSWCLSRLSMLTPRASKARRGFRAKRSDFHLTVQ